MSNAMKKHISAQDYISIKRIVIQDFKAVNCMSDHEVEIKLTELMENYLNHVLKELNLGNSPLSE